MHVRCVNLSNRNAIGAYGGSYFAFYRASAVAIGDLPSDYRPNFDMTEPTYPVGRIRLGMTLPRLCRSIPGATSHRLFFRMSTAKALTSGLPLLSHVPDMTLAEMEMSVKKGH